MYIPWTAQNIECTYIHTGLAAMIMHFHSTHTTQAREQHTDPPPPPWCHGVPVGRSKTEQKKGTAAN
jgi:hypothetical protein